MKKLSNRKYLGHPIYLSATIFFLIHILRIAFYLGTLMASVTEIIQKADGLDFYDAEIVSKGQIEVFAYNNIGKFSQSLNSYISLVLDENTESLHDFIPHFWLALQSDCQYDWGKEVWACRVRLELFRQ